MVETELVYTAGKEVVEIVKVTGNVLEEVPKIVGVAADVVVYTDEVTGVVVKIGPLRLHLIWVGVWGSWAALGGSSEIHSKTTAQE